ncbi:hypothetical protein BDA99DRAFT_131240 [Phascolomyces articulosus]|uniref:Uncharacterized protein n=1 Tax=Phascolomyces articulosus TaxID=60185 RepID=A0AAD5PJ00_9FUNG|nr:hypothetical protein BDA99DRAFT_131240 [Phascolomyces articulosus]
MCYPFRFFLKDRSTLPSSLTCPSDNFSSSTVSDNKTSNASSTTCNELKRGSCEMTKEMLYEYKQAFEQSDDKYKWDLGAGVYVENLMYQFGAACSHEHYAIRLFLIQKILFMKQYLLKHN